MWHVQGEGKHTEVLVAKLEETTWKTQTDRRILEVLKNDEERIWTGLIWFL
jgi:hypothetical protein